MWIVIHWDELRWSEFILAMLHGPSCSTWHPTFPLKKKMRSVFSQTLNKPSLISAHLYALHGTSSPSLWRTIGGGSQKHEEIPFSSSGQCKTQLWRAHNRIDVRSRLTSIAGCSLYKLNKCTLLLEKSRWETLLLWEDGLVPSWGSTNTGMEWTTGMAKKIKFPATHNLMQFWGAHTTFRGIASQWNKRQIL